METVKCPNCGESDYIVMYSTFTAVYSSTQTEKKLTYECRCMNCGKMFSFMPNWEDKDGYED